MKARFLGDPNDDRSGPMVLNLFGRSFPKDRFITISGDDAADVLTKLKANGHFEVADGDGEEPVLAADVAASAFDKDGDGRPGGSRTKKSVIADLDALAAKHPGKVDYDPKTSSNELAARLEELQFELGE